MPEVPLVVEALGCVVGRRVEPIGLLGWFDAAEVAACDTLEPLAVSWRDAKVVPTLEIVFGCCT